MSSTRKTQSVLSKLISFNFFALRNMIFLDVNVAWRKVIARIIRYIRKITARANAWIEESAIRHARWSGMKKCANVLAIKKRNSARVDSNGFLLVAGKTIMRRVSKFSKLVSVAWIEFNFISLSCFFIIIVTDNK